MSKFNIQSIWRKWVALFHVLWIYIYFNLDSIFFDCSFFVDLLSFNYIALWISHRTLTDRHTLFSEQMEHLHINEDIIFQIVGTIFVIIGALLMYQGATFLNLLIIVTTFVTIYSNIYQWLKSEYAQVMYIFSINYINYIS